MSSPRASPPTTAAGLELGSAPATSRAASGAAYDLLTLRLSPSATAGELRRQLRSSDARYTPSLACLQLGFRVAPVGGQSMLESKQTWRTARLIPYALALLAFLTGTSVWARSEPMSFRSAGNGGNCKACAWIAAEGEIRPDTAEKLKAYLAAEKIEYRATIALHSPGGDLAGALKLGEFIRARGVDTTVASTHFGALGSYDDDEPGICASACAYAFLGGLERLVPDGSRLGVHQFTSVNSTGSEADAQQTVAVLANYMAKMGASRDLLVPAGLLPPDGMYWLTRADLERLNVVTDREKVAEANWELHEARGALSLEVRQKREDGRSADYILRCGPDQQSYLLVWSMEVEAADADTAASVAASLRGLDIRTEDNTLRKSLPAETLARGTRVIAGVLVDRLFVTQLARSSTPASISLKMPRSAAAYVGGWTQPFPRSNLARVLPIVARNCGAS